MGKLELPIPDLGKGGRTLASAAKDMQTRIRNQIPAELRNSIVVKIFKRGDKTGLIIQYDDRAENFVYAAIEYPRRS